MADDSNGAILGILKSWTIGGIIPPKKYKYIFVIYSIFVNIFVNLFYAFTTVKGTLQGDDLPIILTNISFVISIVACVSKHFTIFFAKENIFNIIKILKELDQRAKSKDERTCIERISRLCKRIYSAWVGLYYVTFFFLALGKLYAGELLLYPAWFPFDLTIESNLWIAYVYQLFGMIYLALENACLDCFPPIFLIILSVHIKVIGIRIKKSGQATKTSVGSYNQLVACIQDHKLVLRLFQEMSQIIKRTLSVQFILTIFVLCTQAVNIFYFIKTFSDAFMHCFYSIAVILEVLPACYCMNRAIELNSQLTGSIYDCNWIEQDLKFKKILIIFMQNTQKNLVMMAGNITPINLSTFMAIVQLSFSMFTILSQINK